MTDRVAIALISAVQAVLIVWVQRSVQKVHTLVNSESSAQKAEIVALRGEIGRLREDPTATTPEGIPEVGKDAVTILHGQVTVATTPEVPRGK